MIRPISFEYAIQFPENLFAISGIGNTSGGTVKDTWMLGKIKRQILTEVQNLTFVFRLTCGADYLFEAIA